MACHSGTKLNNEDWRAVNDILAKLGFAWLFTAYTRHWSRPHNAPPPFPGAALLTGVITKVHSGRTYSYFEWFEDGRTVQKYCGLAGTTKARRRELGFAIALMERRMDADRMELKGLKKELAGLPEE